MNIHFSNVDFSSRTGPNTFGFRLAETLYSRGHRIVRAEDPYDVFLCFIEPASLPRSDSVFIQRLDGIWFKPEEFETHNRNIKWAFTNSDAVVWQSQFDRDMTTYHWGHKEGVVIHNGINLESVVSKFKLDAKGRLFVCAANWHPQKRLKENINLFRRVKCEGDQLLILGNNVPNDLPLFNDERVMGNLTHQTCLSIYDQADWLIHLAWLDHCPNVVVEALSRKCPIICTDSGGTHEIVKTSGIIIPEQEQYHFELTNYDNPPFLSIENFSLPEQRVEVDNSHLNIEIVTDLYENLFVDLLNQKRNR